MVYEIRFTKEAKKDVAKLTPKLKQKLKKIMALLELPCLTTISSFLTEE